MIKFEEFDRTCAKISFVAGDEPGIRRCFAQSFLERGAGNGRRA